MITRANGETLSMAITLPPRARGPATRGASLRLALTLVGVAACVLVVMRVPLHPRDPFPPVARLLHDLLEERVATVVAWKQGRSAEIERVARDPRLIEGVRASLRGRPVELDALLDRTCLAFEGCALYVGDRPLATFRVREVPPELVAKAERRTASSGVIATDDVGAFHPAVDDARFSIFFATPIALEGARVTLVGRVLADESLDPIMRTGRIGRTGESYAFEGQGYMITRSRFAREIHRRDKGPLVLGRPTFELRTPKETPTLAVSAVRHGRTLGIDIDGYADYRGVTVVGAWRWLAELGAGVITEIDRAEALYAIASR